MGNFKKNNLENNIGNNNCNNNLEIGNNSLDNNCFKNNIAKLSEFCKKPKIKKGFCNILEKHFRG